MRHYELEHMVLVIGWRETSSRGFLSASALQYRPLLEQVTLIQDLTTQHWIGALLMHFVKLSLVDFLWQSACAGWRDFNI